MPNETDQPLSEAELAQIFAEEGRGPAVEPPSTEKPLGEVLDPEPEPPGEPEVVIDPKPGPEIPPEKAREEDPDPTSEPTTIEVPVEGDERPPEFQQAEHLAWAERRNLTSFEDAAKLAWEQERFLGKKASEIQDLKDQLAAAQEQPQETTQRRSDEWIAQALSSPDPGHYALQLAQEGDWDTYGVYMQAWESVQGAALTQHIHNQIVRMLEEEQPEPEQQQPTQNADAVRAAFEYAGIFDLDNDPLRPMLIQVADEMGGQHPLVQSLAQGDPNAAVALVEIARARTLTTRTVRMDGTPVDEGRRAAASLSDGGESPTRTPPKADPFVKLDEEWRRMGVLPAE